MKTTPMTIVVKLLNRPHFQHSNGLSECTAGCTPNACAHTGSPMPLLARSGQFAAR
jgi:hypothetical protein